MYMWTLVMLLVDYLKAYKPARNAYRMGIMPKINASTMSAFP